MQLYEDASNAYGLAPQLLRRMQNTIIIFFDGNIKIIKSKKESTSFYICFLKDYFAIA